MEALSGASAIAEAPPLIRKTTSVSRSAALINCRSARAASKDCSFGRGWLPSMYCMPSGSCHDPTPTTTPRTGRTAFSDEWTCSAIGTAAFPTAAMNTRLSGASAIRWPPRRMKPSSTVKAERIASGTFTLAQTRVRSVSAKLRESVCRAFIMTVFACVGTFALQEQFQYTWPLYKFRGSESCRFTSADAYSVVIIIATVPHCGFDQWARCQDLILTWIGAIPPGRGVPDDVI
jgi:hypothetical protein